MPAVLARMERRGISIDRQVLSRLSGDFAQKQGALEDEIKHARRRAAQSRLAQADSATSCSARWACPAAPRPRPGHGRPARACWRTWPSRATQLPRKILDWRQVSKLRSTYTDALPDLRQSRRPTACTPPTRSPPPRTGRLSSSDPNLQNIPVRTEEGRKIRRAFVAAPGMKLISADYSQIELRLLAHIADMPALRKAFHDGLDIHAMTASEMFGVPVKGMPGEVRRRAKAINFGIIYGISAFGLANQLGIDREGGRRLHQEIFRALPRHPRLHGRDARRSAANNGYVITLFGRKCHYPDIKAANPSIRAFNERAAINAPLQGSAADIIRRAMIRMEAALAKAKLNAQMLLQVHDELIFEVPEDEVAKTLPVVKTRDGRRAAPGGVAARAAAGRRPRRRQLGRGALDTVIPGRRGHPTSRVIDEIARARDGRDRRFAPGMTTIRLTSLLLRRPAFALRRGRLARGFRRQHRDRLDLEQRARPRQLRNRHRSRGRRRRGVDELVAHLAENSDVRHVGKIIVDLHHVLEAGAGRPPARV